MCHVIVHKFRHGLNHHDPTVDQETWNSIFQRDPNAPAAAAPTPAPAAAINPAAPPAGIATTGQINRDQVPDPAATIAATTTGTTTATDTNIPPLAQPDTNPDAPRQDQPHITADQQQAQGGNAGGYTATPTDIGANVPSPAEQAAGIRSTEQQEEQGGAATP